MQLVTGPGLTNIAKNNRRENFRGKRRGEQIGRLIRKLTILCGDGRKSLSVESMVNCFRKIDDQWGGVERTSQ